MRDEQLHGILDYISRRIPPQRAPRPHEVDVAATVQRPIPLAFVAAGPRMRVAAEWHEHPTRGQSELELEATPSPSDLVRRVGMKTHAHLTLPGTLCSAAVDAEYAASLRDVVTRRGLHFPAGLVTEALDLAVWWLTRPQSAMPLALQYEAMLDGSISFQDKTRFPNVAAVTLSGRRLGLDCLAGCDSLEELVIADRPKNEGDFERIPDVVNREKLTSLSLELSGVGDVSWLPQLTNLRYLSLAGCLEMDTAVPVCGLPHLEWLDVSRTGEHSFEWLNSCAALRYLNVSGCTGFEKLQDVAQLSLLKLIAADTSVTTLDLLPEQDADAESETVTEDGSVHARPLAMSLRVLVLTNSLLESLNGVDQYKHLHILDVAGTNIEEFPEGTTPTLHELSVSDSSRLVDFDRVAKCFPTLRVLDVSSCHIDDDDLALLVSLKGTLRVLDVRGCRDIETMPSEVLLSLEELSISSCYALKDVRHILAKCMNLRVLHAQGLEELTSLTWIRSCPRLEVLDVAACEDLKSFCGVDAAANTLHTIDISDTGIRNLLPELHRLKHLSTFCFNDCPLDKKSRAAAVRFDISVDPSTVW